MDRFADVLHQFTYGHDRNSNRLWRDNVVASAAGKKLDEQHEYDNLDRLEKFRRAHDRGLATTPRPRYRRAAMSYTNTLSRRRMNSLPPEIAGYAHVCDPALGIFSAPTVRCAFGSASTRYMVPFSPRQ